MPVMGNGQYPPLFGGTIARIEATFTYQHTAGAQLYTAEGNPFVIPRGARLVDEYLEIITAFNAGDANTLSIGLGTDEDYFYDDAAGGTPAVLRYGASGSVLNRMGSGTTISADTAVTATYAQAGTAASAGQARYVLTYCIPEE